LHLDGTDRCTCHLRAIPLERTKVEALALTMAEGRVLNDEATEGFLEWLQQAGFDQTLIDDLESLLLL
jgi:hypothetical protein